MGIIPVEGLGQVEIEGDVPNAEEQQLILDLLEDQGSFSEAVESELSEAEGLEKIGGRSTFEAIGAIGGSVPGTLAGSLPGGVAGGTLGSAGMGQVYDIVQSALTDEDTDFITQTGKAKKDFQREGLLQTFFAKIPGMGTFIKRVVFADKSKKPLYEAAKRMGYPASLSDTGNIISKSYGRVIGVFPFVGAPIKKGFARKADILNKTANDALNTFAPNVTLTKLGVDMSKAAQTTFDDFRRVSGFFYDDFYKSVNKVRAPIISTKNFKDSINSFIKVVDEGDITLRSGKVATTQQKDAMYKWAKQHLDIPEYITVAQYKALNKNIESFAKRGKTEPVDIKALTGFKINLEKDLNLLTKKSYINTFKKVLDPKDLEQIPQKLKFANQVYSEGLQNSMITASIKNMAKKEGVKLKIVPGMTAFDSPAAREFKKVDKNIFGPGFKVQGSLTADQLGKVLIANRNVTPQLLDDLRSLVGDTQYKNFVRARLQRGYDNSLVKFSEPDKTGLMFDPAKFEANLGLDTKAGRELLESMLKGSNLTLQNLDDFFAIAKNHAGLTIPDVSSFVSRRAVLGGTKSLLGGFAMGYTSYQNPLRGGALIYLARRTSNFLDNPKALQDVMTALDPNSTGSQIKTATLKLVDAMISNSQTKEEENNFKLYREYLEEIPLIELNKELEDDTSPLSRNYFNYEKFSTEEKEDTVNLTSAPVRSIQPLQTANVNPNLLAQAPTGVQTLASGGDKPYSQMTNAEKLQYDRMVRGLA